MTKGSDQMPGDNLSTSSNRQSADLWHHPRAARFAAWTLVLLAALLYLITLDSGLRPDELGGGDLITHQYAQAQARPGNAPGYPLYTMGGWLWFRLARFALGWALNPIQQLSSYSTLWALLALFVLYRLALRRTHQNWTLAFLLSSFYGVTYFFWYYSVTTEQYTLAVLQTLLIVWLAFKWDEESGETEARRYLLLLALAVGTCLANLVTTLFIVPPLLWFVLSGRPELLRRPKLIAQSLGLALSPALSYAYVYWRGATHPQWRGEGQWPSAWAWFVDFLTTQQGRDELAPGLTLTPFFTDEFPSLIWGELTWIVLIGGLIGLVWLGRRRALFIYATLAIYFIFCWVDRFGNWFQVIMPAYPLIVLGFGAGLSALWEREWKLGGERGRQSSIIRSLVRWLLVIALVSLVAYRFALSLPRADQSARPEDSGLEPGWTVLADEPQARSIVIGQYEEWVALQYLMAVWDAEPTVYPRPLCRVDLPETAGGREPKAVYLTRRAALADPACLAERHRYAAGATLIRAQDVPNMELPPSARPASIEFGPHLTLVGFEVQPRKAVSNWHLSLYWRAGAALDVDYSVSVRPLRDGMPVSGNDGQPLIQDHQPVWNAYPTSRWSPGEVVRDDYVLALPAEIVPDGARVVVYRRAADGFENLGEALLSLQP